MVLPPGEAPADWDEVLQEAGLLMSGPTKGAHVEIAVRQGRWWIYAYDGEGGVVEGDVPPPRTRGDREEFAYLCSSLVNPVDVPELSLWSGPPETAEPAKELPKTTDIVGTPEPTPVPTPPDSASRQHSHDPTKLDEVGEPTRPDQADEPTRPDQADEPTVPEQADEPTAPEQADEPTRPEQADEPTKIDQADEPTKIDQNHDKRHRIKKEAQPTVAAAAPNTDDTEATRTPFLGPLGEPWGRVGGGIRGNLGMRWTGEPFVVAGTKPTGLPLQIGVGASFTLPAELSELDARRYWSINPMIGVWWITDWTFLGPTTALSIRQFTEDGEGKQSTAIVTLGVEGGPRIRLHKLFTAIVQIGFYWDTRNTELYLGEELFQTMSPIAVRGALAFEVGVE